MASMTDPSVHVPRPMIVVDDAHVTYKVFAGGKPVGGQNRLLGQRGGPITNEVHAVRGVSFTAAEGETIGVVGHNGSGKSTLFRAMAGLIPTSQGSIRAADRPVLLGVNAALMPELSGENNIKLGLLAMGFTAEEAAAQVNEIADFAELNEFISHPMRTYSSGMGARLRFAIASARPHSILLLDEALAVGDRRFRTKSEARIRNLRDAAGLVMIVSHSPSSLKETCERGLWIHKGELRADGTIKDVIAEYGQWAKNPKSVGVGASTADREAAAARRRRIAARRAKQAALTAAQASDEAAIQRQAIANSHAPSTTVPVVVEETNTAPGEAVSSSTAKTTTLPSTHSTSTSPVPVPTLTSPRDAARRVRYIETSRQRGRRRTRAIGITGAAIVLAVGAGAAIALVTQQSNRIELDELRSAVSNSPTPSPSATPLLPVINAFTAPPTVLCTTTDSSAELTFSWDVASATTVSLTATDADGLTVPVLDALPATSPAQPVSFSCQNDALTYTLVTSNESGQQVTSTLVVSRELQAPEPEQPPVEVTPDAPQPKPTEPPVEPTEPPIEPTEPPVEPTEPPVEPTDPPVEPTDPPVEPTPEEPPAAEPPITTPDPETP